MSDIYLGSMTQVNKCVFRLLAFGFGTVLNTNPYDVVSYIDEFSATLPYPLSCVQPIVDFGSNIFGQALTSLNAGTPMNLNIPPIPTLG